MKKTTVLGQSGALQDEKSKANKSVTTAAVLASNGPSPLHDEDRDGA